MTTRSTTSALMLVLLLSLPACHKQAGQKLGTDPRQRESYSLGYKLGTSLQRQKTSIDVDAYVRGLREAMAGAASQVSDAEIRTAVTSLRDQALAAQKVDDKTKAAENPRRRGARSWTRTANGTASEFSRAGCNTRS